MLVNNFANIIKAKNHNKPRHMALEIQGSIGSQHSLSCNWISKDKSDINRQSKASTDSLSLKTTTNYRITNMNENIQIYN